MRYVFSVEDEFHLIKRVCDEQILDFQTLGYDDSVDLTQWVTEEIYGIIDAFYKYRLGVINTTPLIWLVANQIPLRFLMIRADMTSRYRLKTLPKQGTLNARYVTLVNNDVLTDEECTLVKETLRSYQDQCVFGTLFLPQPLVTAQYTFIDKSCQ